jgi:hypothetical protein
VEFHRLFGIQPAYGRTFRRGGSAGPQQRGDSGDRLALPFRRGPRHRASIRINNEPRLVIMPAEMDQIGTPEAWARRVHARTARVHASSI